MGIFSDWHSTHMPTSTSPDPSIPYLFPCFIFLCLKTLFYLFTFLKDFIYLFLERGEWKESGRETSMCGVWLPLARPLLGTWHTTQACALTGNRTGDPLVCRPVLNPLSYTSQRKEANRSDRLFFL